MIYASEAFPHDAFDYRVLADRRPYVLGEFVWTAIDYIGEAGIGATTRVPIKTGPSFNRATYPWVKRLYTAGDRVEGRDRHQRRLVA